MLSTTRDMNAAKWFFACALKTGGRRRTVITDGHDAYPRALRETLGPDVCHHSSRSMNTCLEPDHRGIKQRSIPCWGLAPVRERPASAQPVTHSVPTSAAYARQ